MNKKFLMLFIFAIFFLSFLSAVPPVTTTQQFTEGYEIRIPQDNILKVNQDFEFEFHVYNISNGVPINSGITCYFHLYNSTGDHQLTLTDAIASEDWDYSFNVLGGNFSTSGSYFYNTQCNSSILGGFHSSIIYVTPNGEDASTGKAVFYIGLLFVLLFFLGISIYFYSDTDNLLAKVGSLGIAYLLLISITFVGWQMSNDFLTSSPFLIEMLRILFFVFVIGTFPLLIGMFAWYLIMLFQIKEINRLMEKGMSYDEAKKRQGSKY